MTIDVLPDGVQLNPPSPVGGGLPSWLPRAKVPVGRVLTAGETRPALTIQGESVSVHLGGGTLLATAAGPTVPERGGVPVPSTSPPLVLTLAKATGPYRSTRATSRSPATRGQQPVLCLEASDRGGRCACGSNFSGT